MTQLLTSVAIALLAAGCANFTGPARSHKLEAPGDGFYWFDYTASRRGAFLAPAAGKFVMCAEPAPDVALDQTTSLAASIKIPEGADANVKADLASKVVELAGRTQTVLFLREAMYRLCEQAMSGNFAPGEVAKLYEKVLDAAANLAEAEKLRAQADPALRDFLRKER